MAKSREQYIAENSEYNYDQDLVSFSLIDEDVIKRREREGDVSTPFMRTKKYLNIPKDERWNTKQLNSKLLQGILNGDPIPKIAQSFLDVVNNNESAAMRNARTMITQAECGGRQDSYENLAEQGVVQKKVWIATPDDRTRESHIDIDGEEVDIDDTFSNGCAYPADPSGDASEVYNCRCSMRTHIIGIRRPDGTIIEIGAERDDTMHDRQMQEEKERRGIEDTQAQDKEPEKGADGKIIRDYDSDFAKYYGEDFYNSMCDLMDNCDNEDLKKVWQQYQSKIKAKDPNFKGHEHHSLGSIYVNKNKDAKGSSWQKPYQVMYHESGHAVDFFARELAGNTTMITNMYSSAYKDGAFPTSIKNEINDLVKAKDTEMKTAFKEHKGDYEWMRDNGYMSDYAYNYYKENGRFLFGEPTYSKSMAYSAIEKEVKSIAGGMMAYGDLSDMLEGATGGKISCGVGHGKSYWKTRGVDRALATEAFAEMTSATVTNKESLEVIKQYLPKSYEMYNDMLKDIAQKGGN